MSADFVVTPEIQRFVTKLVRPWRATHQTLVFLQRSRGRSVYLASRPGAMPVVSVFVGGSGNQTPTIGDIYGIALSGGAGYQPSATTAPTGLGGWHTESQAVT